LVIYIYILIIVIGRCTPVRCPQLPERPIYLD